MRHNRCKNCGLYERDHADGRCYAALQPSTPLPDTHTPPPDPPLHSEPIGPFCDVTAPDGTVITYRVDADNSMLGQMALGAYQSIIASIPSYPHSPATGVSTYGPTRITIVKLTLPSSGPSSGPSSALSPDENSKHA